MRYKFQTNLLTELLVARANAFFESRGDFTRIEEHLLFVYHLLGSIVLATHGLSVLSQGVQIDRKEL